MTKVIAFPVEMLLSVVGVLCVVGSTETGSPSLDTGPEIVTAPSAERVEAYDFFEMTLGIKNATAKNPFTDVSVTGQFRREGEDAAKVEGFCDSVDGGTYRICFMPSKAGQYRYTVTFRQGDTTKTESGKFEAIRGKRRGVLRVDEDYPWHFIWEGTGEHYFFNGNTAFLLMAWQDEKTIRQSLDRGYGS